MGDERTASGTPDRRRNRMLIAGAVAVGVVAAAALATAVMSDLRRQGRPDPSFPSLIATPDPTLHGTIAFISEAKNPEQKERQACARVALASGAAADDVHCWPISDVALATAVWRDDGRLLVTSFQDPPGDAPLEPEWAKIIDVETGASEDVPATDLGNGATPSAGPPESNGGERVTVSSGDGEGTITVSGPSGSRTLLRVTDVNPEWSLQGPPVWSPDFAWVMTWDGRLLLTTATGAPTTRVLAQEASWSPFGVETPNFSIRADDVALS